MQIGGTLITGLVRVLVVVGTLAAISFFVIKPILETTENVTNTVQDSIRESTRSMNEAGLSPNVQQDIRRQIKASGSPDTDAFQKCLQRVISNAPSAGGNPTQTGAQRCANLLN